MSWSRKPRSKWASAQSGDNATTRSKRASASRLRPACASSKPTLASTFGSSGCDQQREFVEFECRFRSIESLAPLADLDPEPALQGVHDGTRGISNASQRKSAARPQNAANGIRRSGEDAGRDQAEQLHERRRNDPDDLVEEVLLPVLAGQDVQDALADQPHQRNGYHQLNHAKELPHRFAIPGNPVKAES